ncbi:TetR/AcrR family transcriptional regulator [Paenibacillus farraposensis]|uniref:TetR/AcrR family transcriptional regulator n=1 Tax=Paenibacillus farraposensis TaxID=2807095 RepID=A0ABW4DCJ3_9BACL|nr:TetR/AcrR family transcriptional regulator [Paenibacillus farraposensis]MCC3379465.1 TetR/AcrR family transcriptional regulator [Paenibacillus farraposensis]
MESKKNDILQAAIRLFSRKGYYSTSVEEIAKESGMAKASFYKYFQGKEELPLEMCIILENNIEQDIRALYSKPDLTNEDKLHDFIVLYLRNLVKNKVYSMMDLPEPSMLIFQNEQLNSTFEQHEYKLYKWVCDCLIDVFGSDIEDYVWDITFVLKSVVFEYIRFFADRMNDETVEHLAQFLLYLTKSLVASLNSTDLAPNLWSDQGWLTGIILSNPFDQGRRVLSLFHSLEDSILLSSWSLEEKQEYQQISTLLKEEALKASPQKGLLKALFSYLEQQKELEKTCHLLKNALNLKPNPD